MSFKEIIQTIQKMPAGTRFKFHASGSSSIVGSDSKDDSGESISTDKKYRIGLPVNRRNKRLTDITVSVLLLISFPVQLLLQKNRLQFFKNIFSVLAGRKTYVGYASPAKQLPALKKGLLSSTSLPAEMNNLPAESLLVSDEWYAADYTVFTDIQKIRRGYYYLGQ
jgi:hypothetical protein